MTQLTIPGAVSRWRCGRHIFMWEFALASVASYPLEVSVTYP